MNKPERYPIAIDNGIYLCNDGTMWKRQPVTAYEGKVSGGWIQLDNVPQPESGVSVDYRLKQRDRVDIYSYTDNCCSE